MSYIEKTCSDRTVFLLRKTAMKFFNDRFVSIREKGYAWKVEKLYVKEISSR